MIASRFVGIAIITVLCCPAFASAEQCITVGDHFNQAHSLQVKSTVPYSHLIGNELEEPNALGITYDLKLKPIVDDFTQLQFQTYDSTSPAAGYTSPYLWNVGQGPGYRGTLWGPQSPASVGPGYSAPNVYR